MIVLDTHIWVWWVHGDERLTQTQIATITAHEADLIGVSAISMWEVAKLVEYGRLELPCPLEEWFEQALAYPGVQLLALTPEIVIESTRLPGEFHRDPADQIIVATARVYDCPLVTSDEKILNYPHVATIGG
jgi:PIN domain nuclease of toxin-antitoxin system